MSTLRWLALCLIGLAGAMLGVAAVQSVQAARQPAGRLQLPEIKLSPANAVQACVRPDRLDRWLAERNPGLEDKFRGIAVLYKKHGEALGIRWDYAFYQMILETNSLKFTGDVKARQNNFAGLGATGGGVRGEVFASVEMGVIAHLQHLVAYSGETVANPVAQRTREHQDGIIFKSKQLGRPVRYSDLVNRWAMDRNYARSIETLAERFRDGACNGAEAAAAPVADTPPPAVTERKPGKALAETAAKRTSDQPAPHRAAGLGMPPACAVMAASFAKSGPTLLIRAEAARAVTFTALGVEGGAEQSMADSFIKAHAPGGRVAGRFKSQDEAVAHAYALCDSGKP